MALEIFDFPFHSFETENPESGLRGAFGNSYIFTAPPTDPDQRKISLGFTGMQYFTNSSGVLDETINAQRNMYNLTKFYQRHKMHKSFQYEHPIHGMMEVKFNKPLKEDSVLPGGFGVVKEFTLEFIEIP